MTTGHLLPWKLCRTLATIQTRGSMMRGARFDCLASIRFPLCHVTVLVYQPSSVRMAYDLQLHSRFLFLSVRTCLLCCARGSSQVWDAVRLPRRGADVILHLGGQFDVLSVLSDDELRDITARESSGASGDPSPPHTHTHTFVKLADYHDHAHCCAACHLYPRNWLSGYVFLQPGEAGGIPLLAHMGLGVGLGLDDGLGA